MDAFDFRKLCADVTHPRPSQEGSFEMLLFYLIMNDLWRGCFPSREGIKGCVTVKVAAWVEGLRDTVSRRLVLQGVIRQALVDAFDVGGSAWAWPSGFGLCPEGGDGEDISHNSGIVVLCLPEYFGESNLLLTFMLSSDFCTGYRAGCSGIYAVVPGRWWEGLTDKVIMSG